jgi:hypothetical protein
MTIAVECTIIVPFCGDDNELDIFVGFNYIGAQHILMPIINVNVVIKQELILSDK